ncbi:MAG: flavodoxin family protein [Faecalibacillus sp.]
MNKRVLILSGSPRKNGNSDELCQQFQKGAEESGHEVKKIYIQDLDIHFCKACYACKKVDHCIQDDDMTMVLEEMGQADVIVLASPVYFYSISAQLKTVIDRTLATYYPQQLKNKEFYFIMTAAEDEETIHRAMDAMYGLTDCVEGAKVKGEIIGAQAWQLGDIEGHPALQTAFAYGKNI